MFEGQSVFSRRKSLVAAAVLAGALTIVGQTHQTAHAGVPNNQGCLGTDFSTYARYGSDISGAGADFGRFNAALAQSVPGLGLPIQFHLAGLIPDSYVTNSCNNP